jgi:hypothetical protein
MTSGLAVVIGLTVLVAFVTAATMTRARSRSKGARRPRSRRGAYGGAGHTVAVHLPSDDPHWQKHSQRKSTRNAKRRKVWAAGTAGAVGAASTDGYSGCSGGGGCGGGGCGGGS